MMYWTKSDKTMPQVVVNFPDQQSLLADIERRFADQTGFSVATINLDHVVKLQRDAAFQNAYAVQSHVVADGNPIVWLCRLAGQSQVALVPGSELIDPIAALAARKNVTVGFFGSVETSLSAAGASLKHRYPDLDIVLTRAPQMGFDPEGAEADAAIEAIAQSGARLVFLALGAPKQERFAAYAQRALPEVGFLSIGAGLDFISGKQTRAPKWVRAIAAEWIWRMLSNPRRLAMRYAACAWIMPRLTLKALQTRHRG